MRQLLLFLLLSVVALCANAEFAPGVVNHVPTDAERTKGNAIHAKALCKKEHGEWFEGKGYAYCVLPYPDAEKVCNSSKDCIGHCIASVKETSVGHGTCQINDSLDDCGRPHYEKGKVTYFNCD